MADPPGTRDLETVNEIMEHDPNHVVVNDVHATPSRGDENYDHDLTQGCSKRELERFEEYARCLPYPVESNVRMQRMLEFILMRMTQCVAAKSFDPGFLQWDSMLSYWKMLKYPIPKQKRIALAKLYFEICTTPGMPIHIIANCSETLHTLVKSKNKLTVDDMRLPWKSAYLVLKRELFLSRRQFEISQLPYYMGYIAETCRRFFHPACIEEILEEIIPYINGTSLDSVLSTQYYLITFLPLSHPQIYLPALFRLWTPINSYMYDDRMLEFLALLAEMHVDPGVSDPERIGRIPDDAKGEGEVRINWDKSDLKRDGPWNGIWKDVGIFTEEEWEVIMCKTLSSMEISLADGGSLTTGPSVDVQASFELGRVPRAANRIASLAKIIVYSMHRDGPATPRSGAASPFAPETLSTAGASKPQVTYIAGSRALDSLIRFIVSTESFFHPSNSGSWTSDLSTFIRAVAFEFNKRWYEEKLDTCNTPHFRRLTKLMRRELVRCLRTVALLGLFSTDIQTVGNILSCLKSMAIMEPDLILPSILERAVPSLEALTETRRTTAVIKALSAVAVSLVARDVYYPGAKHLLNILDLLVPGIDLNDPTKTLCTTAFLIEISQHIRFGELLNEPESMDVEHDPTPRVVVDHFDEEYPRLSETEEDEVLRHTTAGFADWVTTFIRRVIMLMENLPEEKDGDGGSRVGGDTEVEVVDGVISACSQICVHLSDSLFDLVLNLIFDYASTNVRNNAVRAIHSLVECVAVANPVKTLAKFVPFCARSIRTELENGASSVRTTSVSTPLPSDAALHWNIAILRGSLFNDGIAMLSHRTQLLGIFRLLHAKTLSKRGFSWTGKLINSALFTLTHTYPKENRFVNANIWNDDQFRGYHHHHWGKLYKSSECKIEWHVPIASEIEFALQIFAEIVEPALSELEGLIKQVKPSDRIWRNDFCRHLSLVRYAFAGIPTLIQEFISADVAANATATSDLINEIPVFIASVDPLNCGFALSDPKDPRYRYIMGMKIRFGKLLSHASSTLRHEVGETVIDAINMTIRSIRTFMMEYGDSRDSYFGQQEKYNSDRNVARRYAGQRVWPRAVFVTRARLYHAARLRWNSIDRPRTPLHDALIDEIVQWSMFSYSSIRSASQSVLESLISSYDGVRRRCLPPIYQSLEPAVDNDRMKGALYCLNISGVARYIMSEPTLLPEFVQRLFGCQHNEKPSIQDCVSALADNCLSCFAEPDVLVYANERPTLLLANSQLKALLLRAEDDWQLIKEGRRMREMRVKHANKSFDEVTQILLRIGNSPQIHWKYSIGAIRLLRTLVRKDCPILADQLRYFLEKTCDNHPSMRYYAQRAVMKSLRYIKLRTLSKNNLQLTVGGARNPLLRSVPIAASHQFTQQYLENFGKPLNWQKASQIAQLQDKPSSGWLTWSTSIDLYLAPTSEKSGFGTWEPACRPAIDTVRQFAHDPGYWRKLSIHFAEENSSDSVAQDNISCVKSIFQILEEEPLPNLKPTIESLLENTDQNKQRAAAELIAAVIGGSKHWSQKKQTYLWSWLSTILPKMLGSNVRPDTLLIWTTFLEYIIGNKDPRRVQPVIDHLMSEFLNMDYNSDSFFSPVKISSFIRAFSDEVLWRFRPWIDTVVDRYWEEIASDHDEVRTYISEILQLSSKIKWRPLPSSPTTEAFVRECRVLDLSIDIMGIRGAHDVSRVMKLVNLFPIWREQRFPGARALQSTYDKVATMTCKWLYLALLDIQAIMVYDLILPLMPELFRFSEVNDNEELANRASALLTRMCAVSPPKELLEPILDAVFEAIKTSNSWRVRLKALPLVQVWYFRQFPLISEEKVMQMLEVCCACLDDEVIEVREAAAVTLSGILRCSPRRSILILKDRFVARVRSIKLPPRQSPSYAVLLRELHGAILGVTALIESFPYTVEKWTPELLTDILTQHTYDPIPVSTAVRACAANFKKTHQDTWHEDQLRFNEEQLSALQTLLTGSSYYA